MSTEVLERHLAVQQRITEAKDRIQKAEASCQALVFGDATLVELDGDGYVRRSVRTLLPVVVKTPGFKITLMLTRSENWGVRVQNLDGNVEVAAVCLLEPPRGLDPAHGPRTGGERVVMSVSLDVVNELAELLRG